VLFSYYKFSLTSNMKRKTKKTLNKARITHNIALRTSSEMSS